MKRWLVIFLGFILLCCVRTRPTRVGESLPPVDPMVFSHAERLNRFLIGKLEKEELAQVEAECSAHPAENSFCGTFLHYESLKREILRSSTPSPKRKRLRAIIRKGRIQNWEDLRKADIGPLVTAFSLVNPKEFLLLKTAAQNEPKCPNHAAAVVAAMLEDRLPDRVDLEEIGDLYSAAGRCKDSAPVDRENFLTRAGLFYFLAKKYPQAQQLFQEASAIEESYSARALYWECRTQYELSNEREAEKRLQSLRERYPFSFHSLVASALDDTDPESMIRKDEFLYVKRSKAVPDINPFLEQIEILHQFQFYEGASALLQVLEPEVKKLEADVKLYIAELKREQSDYHGNLLLLAEVLTRNPSFVSRGLLERYFPNLFLPIFENNSMGVDPRLIMAIARRESAFNIGAVSSANARGLMQVLPQTARRISGSARMETPEKNIKVGAQYFSHLIQTFEGKTHLALAAYNAGPHRVENWIERYRPLVIDPVLFIDLIPFRETREYVGAVLRNYYWYRRLYGDSSKVEFKKLLNLSQNLTLR